MDRYTLRVIDFIINNYLTDRSINVGDEIAIIEHNINREESLNFNLDQRYKDYYFKYH